MQPILTLISIILIISHDWKLFSTLYLDYRGSNLVSSIQPRNHQRWREVSQKWTCPVKKLEIKQIFGNSTAHEIIRWLVVLIEIWEGIFPFRISTLISPNISLIIAYRVYFIFIKLWYNSIIAFKPLFYFCC